MNRLQSIQPLELPAVLIDERLDVRRRLEQLRAWQQQWEYEDGLLEQRVRHLAGDNAIDIQKGAQIASLRKESARGIGRIGSLWARCNQNSS